MADFPCYAFNRIAADFDPDYPKLVGSQEQLEALGPGWFLDPVEAAAWEPPKLTGPSLEEYVKAGYHPSTYPPRGYAAQDTPAWREYQAQRASEAASVAAVAEAARQAADALEVAAAEKTAAIAVLDAKIHAALEASDEKELDRLVAEKTQLVQS